MCPYLTIKEVNTMKLSILLISLYLMFSVSQADAAKSRGEIKQETYITIKDVRNLLTANRNEVFVGFSAGGAQLGSLVSVDAGSSNSCKHCKGWTNSHTLFINFAVATAPGFSAGNQEDVKVLSSCIEGNHGNWVSYDVDGYKNRFARKKQKLFTFKAKCILKTEKEFVGPSTSPHSHNNRNRHHDESCGSEQPNRPGRTRDNSRIEVCEADAGGGRRYRGRR